jgi:glycosyltransferase involved in cell wall biosynthesis
MFASINPIVILENIKTKQWEKRISYSMPSIYISKNDAVATDSNATIIPNCVVNEDYQEAISAQVLSPSIGFIGNMKYQPNIEACDFLCNEIFPALLNTRPDIQLYIIGRNPGKRLLKHNQHPNIHITGSVSNIWSYVKPIDAFIFPMVSGAGLQNKVLEAMYAGKPVICSQIANEGIDAVHEKELYIANTISEYVMHTEKALLQGNSVGECAKNFIENHFSLQNCVDLLEQTITLKSPGNFSSTTKTL